MSHTHQRPDPIPVNSPDSAYQDRVFADLGDERDRILGALMDASTGPALRIANRMATCCRSPILLRDRESETLRLSEHRCRSRCCPRCRRFRAREIQYRLMQACEKMDARRFLTLTMVSTDDSLANRLKALRGSFARLRRHAFWKSRVTGGVYCVEVTWNPELKQWHPHLHAIIDGKYVPKPRLIEAWKEATGDSYIVHIESVHSASRCASYVAKYASKSDDAAKLPDHKVAEWAESVHGLRLVHTFGNLHGVQLVEKPEKAPGVCIEVCNPSWMAEAANGGDLIAASILRSIDRSAAGCPVEADSLVLKRIQNWQSWMLLEARSRREALPPPDPPPQGVMFPE